MPSFIQLSKGPVFSESFCQYIILRKWTSWECWPGLTSGLQPGMEVDQNTPRIDPGPAYRGNNNFSSKNMRREESVKQKMG